MSVLQVSKALAYGTCGGLGLMAIAAAKPRTERAEKTRNSIYTAADLGALAATPYLVKEVVLRNPEPVKKVVLKTGNLIERIIVFFENKAPIIIERVRASKFGVRVLDALTRASEMVVVFVKKNEVLKNIAKKTIAVLEKFVAAPAATKGKYGLIAGGVLLLTHLALKTIKNHYRKDGAIEQKYADLKKA